MAMRMMTSPISSALALCLMASVAGCDEESSSSSTAGAGGAEATGFELVGEWMTPFSDVPVSVTESEWSDEWSTSSIVDYDNETNTVYLQSTIVDADSGESHETFTASAYTDPGADGALFFCTYSFGHSTLDDAKAAEDASDATDLEGEGCGGFAWTKMTPE